MEFPGSQCCQILASVKCLLSLLLLGPHVSSFNWMLLYFRFFYTCATLIIAFTSAGEGRQLGGRNNWGGDGWARYWRQRAHDSFIEPHCLWKIYPTEELYIVLKCSPVVLFVTCMIILKIISQQNQNQQPCCMQKFASSDSYKSLGIPDLPVFLSFVMWGWKPRGDKMRGEEMWVSRG